MSHIIILDEDSFFEKLRSTIREEMNRTSHMEGIPEAGPIEFAMKLTGLKKNTIYCMVSKREIPYYKKGKKLFFKREELIQWMLLEKRNTMEEKLEIHSQNLIRRLGN